MQPGKYPALHQPPGARRTTRRQWHATAGGAVVGPLAALACSPNGGASQREAASAAPVRLEFWHPWSGQQYEGPTGMIARIGDAFQAKNPHMTVAASNLGSDIITKLITASAGGTPPDVVILFNSSGQLYRLAHQGVIAAMQDVAGNEIGKVKDWVHPNVWDLGLYRGKVYGLPLWTQASALMWHKAHFREVGLDPEKVPVGTLEELPSVGQKLSKRELGAGSPYTRLGFWDGWFGGNTHLALMRYSAALGGQWVDAQGSKVTANSPNNVRALEWIVNTLRLLDFPRVQEFQASLGSISGGPYLAGRYSMWPDGPWRLRTLQLFNLERDDFGVGPLPAPAGLTGGFDYHYGDIPGIPKGARQGAAGWRFVRFLTGFDGEETYADLLLIQPQVPISEKFTKGAAFKKVLAEYPGYDVWLEHFFGAKRLVTPPKIPTAEGYLATLKTFVDQAVKGELSARDALGQANAGAQSELEAASAGA